MNIYLKKDNGVLQYNWVCQPNCTEPGMKMVMYPNSPLSTTGSINRLNGIKSNVIIQENQPVGLESKQIIDIFTIGSSKRLKMTILTGINNNTTK